MKLTLLVSPVSLHGSNTGNNFPGISSQFAMHFYMTAIQDIFCVAVFLHRSVQNVVWNVCLLTEIANQIWREKLFPVISPFFILCGVWCWCLVHETYPIGVKVHHPDIIREPEGGFVAEETRWNADDEGCRSKQKLWRVKCFW